MSLGSWIVGRAASPIFMWIVVAASAAMIGIVGLHLWHDHTVKKERDAAIEAKGQLSERVDRLTDTINRNEIALKVCLDANAANAMEADKQKANAEKAAKRVTELESKTNTKTETIKRESKTFNKGLDCPAYTPDYVDWLCSSTGQSCD